MTGFVDNIEHFNGVQVFFNSLICFVSGPQQKRTVSTSYQAEKKQLVHFINKKKKHVMNNNSSKVCEIYFLAFSLKEKKSQDLLSVKLGGEHLHIHLS